MRGFLVLLAAAMLLCLTIGSGFLSLGLFLQGEVAAAFLVLAGGMGCLLGAMLLVVLSVVRGGP